MISYLLIATVLSTAMAQEPNDTGTNSDSPSETEASDTDDGTTSASMGETNSEAGVQESTELEESTPEAETDPAKTVNTETTIDSEQASAEPALEESDETEASNSPSEVTTTEKSDETDNEQTEIEQMMLEIMKEMAETEAIETEAVSDAESEDSEEYEEFNYKGNLEYSYVMVMWDSPERNTFHVAQFSGDPQYYFKQSDDWGYTLGARFQVTGSETLLHQYYHTILGVTSGLQYKAFRINTAASWNFEQYFAQSEMDRADGFVTYQYNELAQMSGLLWENTLTYSPTDMDFGVQASIGFPFQMSGEREMGTPFADAWQVGTRLNLSFLQLGYTHMVYPGHSIQRVQIGTGILF